MRNCISQHVFKWCNDAVKNGTVELVGFADDLQASDEGPLESRVLQKLGGFEVVRLFDQIVGFIENVL